MPKGGKKNDKDASYQVICRNRRASHDYFIEKKIEAGIALMGTEVKSLRMGRASLQQAWIDIDDSGQAWLQHAHIPLYLQGSWTNHATERKRKLLMHKREIRKLDEATQAKGYTLIPLELYFLHGRIKVLVGLCRGKQEFDKRQALRKAQDEREARRSISHYLKGRS